MRVWVICSSLSCVTHCQFVLQLSSFLKSLSKTTPFQKVLILFSASPRLNSRSGLKTLKKCLGMESRSLRRAYHSKNDHLNPAVKIPAFTHRFLSKANDHRA
ncbi:hypothetical protein QBC41DRAFT_326790 [Cercophora samala]|uniref:Secreted protein n=1 Tax=Cercophora samala TaxID=330535 RepID=A0AA39Z884_9PEZI|nr:hypothetical protein QBC41DRAFT_326790 [Cercophora samala]